MQTRSPGSSPLEKPGKEIYSSVAELMDEHREELEKIAALDDSEIDYSDIPEIPEDAVLTPTSLAKIKADWLRRTA